MAKIKLRRDTASNWTSADPTLAAGEPGYESDTGLFKYGDGATAWTALDYAPAYLTVGTEGAASGDGGISYDIGTAVLTYTPPDVSALIGLTNISVGTEAVASGDGGIAYNNTTGVFTYTPPTALSIGAVALTALSVGTEAAASGGGGIAYDNTTGVFTYTPTTKLVNGAHELVVGSTGVLTFPDASVQTTAFTGGVVPATSAGVAGDKVGMIAANANYLYTCTADYTDGLSDIWSRTAVTASTW